MKVERFQRITDANLNATKYSYYHALVNTRIWLRYLMHESLTIATEKELNKIITTQINNRKEDQRNEITAILHTTTG